MIKLKIDKDKITLARQIEGRKFKEGFWYFPENSLYKLKQLNLIDNDYKEKEKEFRQFEISDFLREYQKETVNKALNYNSYGIFSDTGTGKTIMGLEIANHFNKTLVVCPLSIINTAWVEDCNKFYPHLKCVNLWATTKKKRLENLKENGDIYIINYEGLKIILDEIKHSKFDCILVDESSKIKNMNSQITSIILSLVDYIPNRYILSGCPTPNHNSEIFPQMKFVNNEIFGNNYYGFLAKYFSQDMSNPHRWYQTDYNKKCYYDRLSEQSIFIKKEDVVDLPDKTFLIRNVELNKLQKQTYNNIMEDIKDNINIWSKFEFTAKLMKLREVCDGFIIGKDKTITNLGTNKDNELQSTIEEIGNKPIIVWCQFTYEIERLAKKFNGIALTSKTKNRDKIINDFKNNKIHLLFTHPKLLGMGNTFTNCNYNIYYSQSFSYEEFKQSQDRIHRIGQNNKCTYIILQCKQTIDKTIYNYQIQPNHKKGTKKNI